MRKRAKNISFDVGIGPGFDGEYSLEDETDWLRQYVPFAYARARGYLLEGDESWPVRIWEQVGGGKANHLETCYKLVYEQAGL